jgi:hypothetical protein
VAIRRLRVNRCLAGERQHGEYRKQVSHTPRFVSQMNNRRLNTDQTA